MPEPEGVDPGNVILFGSYGLWRYAEAQGYRPGVLRIRPFAGEAPWRPYLLNGPGALTLRVEELPDTLAGEERAWFARPVSGAKELAGRVFSSAELVEVARKVLSLAPEEIPGGSLRPETEMMLCPPARILKEWRCWVVDGEVVTWSLYKEGRRVVYRSEIDDDALSFAPRMVALNPGYQAAYVLDVCLTEEGLRLLETNCLNAAGLYAADLGRLVNGLEAGLGR